MAPQTPGAVHAGGQTQPAHQQSAINTRSRQPLHAEQGPLHHQQTAPRTTGTIRYQKLFPPYPQCCLSQKWTNTPVCHDLPPPLQTLYQYSARPDCTYPWGQFQRAVSKFDPEMFLPVLVPGYPREHVASSGSDRSCHDLADSMSRILRHHQHSQK